VWIHLLRHGIAIDDDDPQCPNDADRFLTERGASKTRAAARGIVRLGIVPDTVYASPYVRAQQTAEIVREALKLDHVPCTTRDDLVPHEDPRGFIRLLHCVQAEHVLCVGHAPHLDWVVAYLVGSERPITQLKKAGLCTVVLGGAGTGLLHAVYPPRTLRNLGDRGP
jgi:phosphohistidine phosphatase